jgi:short-subunit dehydrogenase
MVERGRGGILMISSGFGLTFMPGFAGYIGTKHFLSGFTEGLRLDLAGTGVVVTQVCPGPVATEFESHVGNFTGAKIPGIVEISAERCARAAVRGLVQGRALVVPGLLVGFGLFLAAITPRFLLRAIYWLPARMLRKLQQQRALGAPTPATGGGAEPPPQ